MDTSADIFSRSEALLGKEGLNKLASIKVIVFGVGGVGSWCAEALVRTGVGHLTLVDPDEVCYSNINRQLPATTETVGRPKVEVLKERFLSINPEAEIQALHGAFHAENAETFHLDAYDYVIDAIDSLEDKAELILAASRLENGTLFSSMGAAKKLDPSLIRTAEFWKVHGCPLAKALRTRFKKNKRFPEKKFLCVFSEEKGLPGVEKGSLMPVTAMFGLQLASLVINHSINTIKNTAI